MELIKIVFYKHKAKQYENTVSKGSQLSKPYIHKQKMATSFLLISSHTKGHYVVNAFLNTTVQLHCDFPILNTTY